MKRNQRVFIDNFFNVRAILAPMSRHPQNTSYTL